MRLVEDDRVVLGEHAGAVAGLGAERQVGEVEGVVRDHELGLLRPARAPARRSSVARNGQRRPAQRSGPTASSAQSVGARLERELGAVAGLRRRDPVLQALVPGRVLGRPEERQPASQLCRLFRHR